MVPGVDLCMCGGSQKRVPTQTTRSPHPAKKKKQVQKLSSASRSCREYVARLSSQSRSWFGASGVCTLGLGSRKPASRASEAKEVDLNSRRRSSPSYMSKSPKDGVPLLYTRKYLMLRSRKPQHSKPEDPSKATSNLRKPQAYSLQLLRYKYPKPYQGSPGSRISQSKPKNPDISPKAKPLVKT